MNVKLVFILTKYQFLCYNINLYTSGEIKVSKKNNSNNRSIEINKGVIKDNAIKALVKSNVFRPKIEKKLKGKGSYSRKTKNKVEFFSTFNLFSF